MKLITARSYTPFIALVVMLMFTQQTMSADIQGTASGVPLRNSCVILDNDFDIDDMMAIPVVLGNLHVAALVQSEGYTMPAEAAPAIDALVNHIPDRPLQRKVPIIVAGKQAEGRDLKNWSWIPFFRSMMNRSNGLIANPGSPWPEDVNYPQTIKQSVAHCKHVSVLVIGTYTSFIHYSPLIRDKIDKVVVMGQPINDMSRTPGRESFNCSYDLPACQSAMYQLVGLKTYFVDIPRMNGCRDTSTPASDCYTPNLSMVTGESPVKGLLQTGLPGRLRTALVNDIDCAPFYTTPETEGNPCSSKSTWEPAAVASGPGGESLLWDQSAALFLVKPSLFYLYYPPQDPSLGGRHYEPVLIKNSDALAVSNLRKNWTRLVNNSVKIK